MTNNPSINVPSTAVSVIGGDTGDDFPVLKAFQQYIDAEQDKARRRMLSLCIFFGCLMTLVIVVFVVLLTGVSQRNQALNDRLIEYVMKDRQAAVVVQPPTDNSAVYGLTAKLEAMERKLEESQKNANAAQERVLAAEKAAAEKAAAESALRIAREKAKIQEEMAITRLKAELAAEREKAAAEKEKRREAELEAYRRKHYPEFYAKETKPLVEEEKEETEADIDALLDELSEDAAIDYFSDDEDDAPKNRKDATEPAANDDTTMPTIKGARGKWRIPSDK